MATGYDTRQPTRDTFAFSGPNPVQTNTGASGQSLGAQLVGGQSAGGMVVASPQTDAGPVGAGLGAFFEQVMKPHIEQRQREEFFKGFSMAQSGVALDEIKKSHGVLDKIFGPSSYEEGAAFYTAKSKINDWQNGVLQDIDNFKKMPPDEAAKALDAQSQKMMTGNPVADQLIQQGMIEASAPLLNTVAKARYEWQQKEAVNAWSSAGDSGAAALQGIAVQQAALSDPSDEDRSALNGATTSFLASMAQPHGMSDEAYHKGLVGFMKNAAQSGNFYAIEAMRKAGFERILTDDEQVSFEKAYDTAAEKAMGDASMSTLVGDMADYEGARAKGTLSPMDAMKRLSTMNAKIRAATGVDRDMFDFKDMRGEVRSIMDLTVAAARRAQERRWQLEDRAQQHQWKLDEKAADQKQEAAAVGAVWASGDVSGGIAAGLPEGDFNALALANYRNGDLSGLARAFQHHYVSSAVRNDVQGMVASSIDEQYGTNMETAHKQWKAMHDTNPGMARAYYGDWNDKMLAFDTLARQVGPEQANTRAFGDPARYSIENLSAAQRKEATDSIGTFIDNNQPYGKLYYTFLGGYRLSDGAKHVITSALGSRVALSMKNSDAPANVLVPSVGQAMLADGSLQIAGGEAWRAAPGTKPFRVQVGLLQDEADKLFHVVVGNTLRRTGIQSVTNSWLDINYVEMPNGNTALHVVAHDRDGADTKGVIIPIADFKAAIPQVIGRIPRDFNLNTPRRTYRPY